MISILGKFVRFLTRIDEILRTMYYKHFFRWGYWGCGVRIGKGVVFQGPKSSIFLFDYSEVLDNSRIILTGDHATVVLERNASIGYSNFVNVHSRFLLGENSMTGPFVSINDSDHRVFGRDPVRFSGYSIGKVEIGKNVWIGTGARILKNVSIGDGAIIGANAVVTKSIPEWCVAVGVPAEINRVRAKID
jgi:acetyltransferase-like isoleucine patch superfamily enzyme